MASTQFTANSNGEKGGKKFGFWALIIVITLAVLILIFNSFTVVNEGYIGDTAGRHPRADIFRPDRCLHQRHADR